MAQARAEVRLHLGRRDDRPPFEGQQGLRPEGRRALAPGGRRLRLDRLQELFELRARPTQAGVDGEARRVH